MKWKKIGTKKRTAKEIEIADDVQKFCYLLVVPRPTHDAFQPLSDGAARNINPLVNYGWHYKQALYGLDFLNYGEIKTAYNPTQLIKSNKTNNRKLNS